MSTLEIKSYCLGLIHGLLKHGDPAIVVEVEEIFLGIKLKVVYDREVRFGFEHIITTEQLLNTDWRLACREVFYGYISSLKTILNENV